jgi:succinylglutamate desuccinylase
MQLTILDELPLGLLDCSADQLHQYLPGPSLINLPGQKDQVLFVSVLLHGNEYTGWESIKLLLKKYQQQPMPRSLSLFIGNVQAAKAGRRLLDGQQDYNRIWKQAPGEGEYEFAGQLLRELENIKPLMGVDIHNNTGLNPHYACVNKLEKEYLHLATLFSRTVVYFTSPDSVLSIAMAELFPAVTVECGKPDDQAGVEHAFNFLEACLHLDHFPSHPVTAQDIDVFHTVATVRVKQDTSIGFGDEPAELRFIPGLDRLNFNELPEGTMLATAAQTKDVPFVISNEQGEDVSGQFFANRDGRIVTTTPLMPSMLTLDKAIIQQDVLCYLMERYPLN